MTRDVKASCAQLLSQASLPCPLSLRSSSVSKAARLSGPMLNVAATGKCGVSS